MAIETILTDQVIQYGAFGALIVFYGYDKIVFHKEVRVLIENNTKALTRAYDQLKK